MPSANNTYNNDEAVELIPPKFLKSVLTQQQNEGTAKEEDTASETSSERSHISDHNKQVGNALWKTLLSRRQEYQQDGDKAQNIRSVLLNDDGLALDVMDGNIDVDDWAQTMLASIVIMDGENEACHNVLKLFPGSSVSSVSDDLINAIKRHTPDFHARVGDFNENLSYSMQAKGLSNLVAKEAEVDGSVPQSCNLKEMLQNELEPTLSMAVGSLNSIECAPRAEVEEYQGSFMRTEETIPQPPHVDFEWTILEEQHTTLRIGFSPLTEDGMFLQVWPTAATSNIESVKGILIYVPRGKLLCMPSNTIHAGGFQSCPNNGNLRFHLYFSTFGTPLPKFQNNRYTEPSDKTKELSARYHNHPQLEKLCRILFT